MANLAILGHATRGQEVIEILEMLGGRNKYLLCGESEPYFFFIQDGIINCDGVRYVDDHTIYTIEEFLEKFPYKVGDKVLYKTYGIYSAIKTMKWNSEKGQVFYRLDSNKLFVATADELEPLKEV